MAWCYYSIFLCVAILLPELLWAQTNSNTFSLFQCGPEWVQRGENASMTVQGSGFPMITEPTNLTFQLSAGSTVVRAPAEIFSPYVITFELQTELFGEVASVAIRLYDGEQQVSDDILHVGLFVPPIIQSVSPSTVDRAGGSLLRIEGDNFRHTSKIKVGFYYEATGFHVEVGGSYDEGVIICVAPPFKPPGADLKLNGTADTLVMIAMDGQNFAASSTYVSFYERPVLKVGFIFSSPIDDFGWTFIQNYGRMKLEAEYSGRVETHYLEDVPYDFETSYAALTRLVSPIKQGGLGCSLVFSGSFDFFGQTLQAGHAFPLARFVHFGGFPSPDDPPNVSYAFGRIYQMRYLAGMVAAKHVKRCVGYVAPFESVPEVRRGINAFAQGCVDTNPACVVKVLWIHTWHDPEIETGAAEELWEAAGCDMIAQHTDSEEPQKVFLSKGGLGIGYNSDMRVLVGDSVLTSAMLEWFPVMNFFTSLLLNDAWEPLNVFLGVETGAVTLAPFAPAVSYETRAEVSLRLADMERGDFRVFCGFPRTNSGEPPPAWQLEPDPNGGGRQCVTEFALLRMDPASNWTRPVMDWHWEGVLDLGVYVPPDVVPASTDSNGVSTDTLIAVLAVVVLAVVVGGTLLHRQQLRHMRSVMAEEVLVAQSQAMLFTKEQEALLQRVMNEGLMANTQHGDGAEAERVKAEEAERLKAYKIDYETITLETLIGHGSFGEVWRAKMNSSDVALKRLLPNRIDNSSVNLFKAELLLMTRLHHPHIVQMYGACWDPPHVCLVLEYMEKGGLDTVLRSQEDSASLSWTDPKLNMAISVAQALAYLHAFHPPIIHRDLKAANIMVTRTYTVRLGDFGSSRVDDGDSMTVVGTYCWMAPEVLAGWYDQRADIYSFAMLLLEMAVEGGDLPAVAYGGISGMGVLRAASNGQRPDLDALASDLEKAPGLRSLIERAWADKVEERPSASELVSRLEGVNSKMRRRLTTATVAGPSHRSAAPPPTPPVDVAVSSSSAAKAAAASSLPPGAAAPVVVAAAVRVSLVEEEVGRGAGASGH